MVTVGEQTFETISEALEFAKSGAKILVGPGTYEEALTIDKTIELIGKDQPTLTQPTGTILTVTSPAKISGFIFKGKEVVLKAQQGHISDCQFHISEGGQAVRLSGPVHMKGCQIGGEVFVRPGNATLEDCQSGAVSALQSTVKLYRCYITGDEDWGIGDAALFVRMARCVAEDTKFHGGGLESWGGELLLRRCEIKGQKIGLLSDKTRDRCVLEECDFIGSKEIGLDIRPPGSFYLWRCRILDGGIGLRAGPNTQVVMQNCEVRGNSGDAVCADTAIHRAVGKIWARHCLITENGGVGLKAAKGGYIEADHCTVVGNGEAWQILDDSEIDMEDCHFDSRDEHHFSPDTDKRMNEDEFVQSLLAGVKDFQHKNLERVKLNPSALKRWGGFEIDFTGLNFAHANLSHSSLSELNLSSSNFRGADLSGCHLSHCDLTNTDFERAQLKGANAFYSPLFGSNLKGVDWSEGTIHHEGFGSEPDPNRESIDLTGARLVGTLLRGDFQGTNFQSVTARRADFREAVISSANFSEAKLQKAIFGGSQFRPATAESKQVCFHQAKLKMANLSSRTFHQADFTQADLGSVNFSHSDLTDSNFEDAQLGSIGWMHAELKGAKFSAGFAEKVQRHQDQMRRTEEEKEQQALIAQRNRVQSEWNRVAGLALQAFGPSVESFIDQSRRVGRVVLVRDYQIPQELANAAEQWVNLEKPIAEQASMALVGLDYYAKYSKANLPSQEPNQIYRELYDFAKFFYPAEMEFEQGGEGEFISADDMREYREVFTKDSFTTWMKDYLIQNATTEAAAELGIEQETREQSLENWLRLSVPLLFGTKEKVTAFGLTDEGNENVEYGLYLVVGESCAVVVRRHWNL